MRGQPQPLNRPQGVGYPVAAGSDPRRAAYEPVIARGSNQPVRQGPSAYGAPGRDPRQSGDLRQGVSGFVEPARVRDPRQDRAFGRGPDAGEATANPAAARLARPGSAAYASPEEARATLERLLDNPKQLTEVIKMRFGQYSEPSATGERVIGPNGLSRCIEDIGKRLQIDPSAFADMQQVFFRFDFDGDNQLNIDEFVKLSLYVLRKYRDTTKPKLMHQSITVNADLGIPMMQVEDGYTIIKKLGEGGQGAVFLAEDKTPAKRQKVVKVYDSSNPNAPIEDIRQEFNLLKSLKHPRIARVFEIFRDWSAIYIVQEPYFGGDLTTAVSEAYEHGVKVNEAWQARVMIQVLQGIQFLHQNSVMHCDLKEANVMVTGDKNWQSPQVVVIDFGLANEFSQKSRPGGTPGYMPPEVWQYGLWTPRGDVFSLGVMMFAMRTGIQPFVENCRNLDDVQYQTLNYEPTMKMGSENCKSLVMDMIRKNFHERPVVSKVMRSPWFSQHNTASQDDAVSEDVLRNITNRANGSKLKKAFLADMASQENLAARQELNSLFISLDNDNDGVVTADEVRRGLEGKWDRNRIEALIEALHGDCEGVSYEEFMGQLIEVNRHEVERHLEKAFKEAGGGKEYLDVKDMAKLLKRPAVAKVIGENVAPEDALIEMDTDGDGKITFCEFLYLVNGANKCDLPALGDPMQYYSNSYHTWIDCTVTKVDPVRNAVMTDCKPGRWFQGPNYDNQLRRPQKRNAHSKKGAIGRQIVNGFMKLMS